MNNSHRAHLEHKLALLRTRRTEIRNKLGMLERGLTLPSPHGHMPQLARDLAVELRSTDREWGRLHHELGRRLPGSSVKLDVPATPARPKVRTVPTFMTRMIGGPGCT